MRLRWPSRAQRSLNGQLSYIAARNPFAAADMLDEIEAAVDRLRDFPESGRPGRLRGTRELPVVGTPFLIVYRVKRTMVEIVRVLHGAQKWPPAKKSGH
jgi:toxin ParE1/3/4